MALNIKILAGFLGPVILFTLLLNLLLVARAKRRDEAIRETIASFKAKTQELEDRLRNEYELSFDEAVEKLKDLGAGFIGWILWISARVPADFERRWDSTPGNGTA